MLRRQRAKSHAENRVGASRVALDGLVQTARAEKNPRAVRAPDPVALHRLDRIRPARQIVQAVQQLVGVGGDFHKIHRDFAPLDQRARTPTAPLDDLLVGEHGVVDRIPIDRRGFAIHQPAREKAREQLLLPAIVIRIASGELARPINGQPQPPHLLSHLRDIVARPAGGVDFVVDRGVFRRQAESVPSHRLHHFAPAHAPLAGNHIADGVVAHMPHVQPPGRIRKHRQAIKLLAARVLLPRREGVFGLPQFLRLALDARERIGGGGGRFFAHSRIINPRPAAARDRSAPAKTARSESTARRHR